MKERTYPPKRSWSDVRGVNWGYHHPRPMIEDAGTPLGCSNWTLKGVVEGQIAHLGVRLGVLGGSSARSSHAPPPQTMLRGTYTPPIVTS